MTLDADRVFDAYADDEIDPADFFDPEEFGFHGRGFNASCP